MSTICGVNNGCIWVVVSVESGIPVSAEPFSSPSAALKRERALRNRMNPDNDETRVFEVPMPRERERRPSLRRC